MRKALAIAALLVVALAIGAYAFREPIGLALFAWKTAPEHAFGDQPSPPPPDYASPESWAALPSTDEPADQMPEGAERKPTGVAVFFVHPTTYIDKHAWNQPPDEPRSRWILEQRVLRNQATVFNGCCDVYVPRYRQATLFAFVDEAGNGNRALELACSDVVRAFENFVGRLSPDQAFVLAGHSQGTRHATRLLRERIASGPLLSRLVVAYLVGFSVTAADLGGVPVCESERQTGCVVAWNAIDGEGAGMFGKVDDLLCVNPLSWTTGTQHVGHERNAGAIGYASYGSAREGEDVSQMRVEVGAADARCWKGQLVVDELRSDSFPARPFGNALHIYDYSLFHVNVRDNVAQRIAAFEATTP